MAVVLTLGLALASLAFKQTVLSSSATQSGFAFYAADSAMECALHEEQFGIAFAYTEGNTADSFNCGDKQDGSNHVSVSCYNTPSCTNYRYTTVRVPLDNGAHCADVTVYEANPATTGKTYLFTQGYNVSCSAIGANAAIVARGLEAVK
jgi:hypothetical protein